MSGLETMHDPGHAVVNYMALYAGQKLHMSILQLRENVPWKVAVYKARRPYL